MSVARQYVQVIGATDYARQQGQFPALTSYQIAQILASGGAWYDLPNDSITSAAPASLTATDNLFVWAETFPTAFFFTFVSDGAGTPVITVDLGLTWTHLASVSSGTAQLDVFVALVQDPSTIGGGGGDDIVFTFGAGFHYAAMMSPIVWPYATNAPVVSDTQTATGASPIEASLASISGAPYVFAVASAYFQEWAERAPALWNTNTPVPTNPAGWDTGDNEVGQVDGVVGFPENSVELYNMANYLRYNNLSAPPAPEQSVFGDDQKHPTWTITDPDGFTTIHELAAVTVVVDAT